MTEHQDKCEHYFNCCSQSSVTTLFDQFVIVLQERHRTKQLLAAQEILFPGLYHSLLTAMKPLMARDRVGMESSKMKEGNYEDFLWQRKRNECEENLLGSTHVVVHTNDINVMGGLVKLRKTRPRRQKAISMEEIIAESLAFSRFSSASHDPRARLYLVLVLFL